MLNIKFTFDNKKFFISDISNESTEDINKCLWILLHTLDAKQVNVIMEEDKK